MRESSSSARVTLNRRSLVARARFSSAICMSFTLSHLEELQLFTEYCLEIIGATTISVRVVHISMVIGLVWMGYPIIDQADKSACGM